MATRKSVGRPTLYKRAYCEAMVTFCREGYSITAYAGEIGVSRDTLSEWGKTHSEFSVALSRAKAAAARWWEERGRKVGEKGGGPGTATMIVFQLRNMAGDDFAEKSEVEHSGGLTLQITPDDAAL